MWTKLDPVGKGKEVGVLVVISGVSFTDTKSCKQPKTSAIYHLLYFFKKIFWYQRQQMTQFQSKGGSFDWIHKILWKLTTLIGQRRERKHTMVSSLRSGWKKMAFRNRDPDWGAGLGQKHWIPLWTCGAWLGPGRQPSGEVGRGDAWGVLGVWLVSEVSAVKEEPWGTVQTDERWSRENPEGD